MSQRSWQLKLGAELVFQLGSLDMESLCPKQQLQLLHQTPSSPSLSLPLSPCRFVVCEDIFVTKDLNYIRGC